MLLLERELLIWPHIERKAALAFGSELKHVAQIPSDGLRYFERLYCLRLGTFLTPFRSE